MKIIQSQSKPFGCNDRQSRSPLMRGNKQSLGCSLRLATKERRKGHKTVSKLVVAGLIYKALESEKVSFLKALFRAESYSHIYLKSYSIAAVQLLTGALKCVFFFKTWMQSPWQYVSQQQVNKSNIRQ